MRFMLDTNACVAIINGTPAPVRMRYARAVEQGATITTSSIVVFELWYGVAKSGRREVNSDRIKAFFAGTLDVLAFTDQDARVAGEIRAALQAAGTPIGTYDILIAGHACRNDAVLVTNNRREFKRIQDLTIEDWTRPL
jgi:tRNA(fMet)-specific endonuclease VapC